MTIPPELRKMIYDLAFTSDPTTPKHAALAERVPAGLAIRLTSRFIANESQRCYLKAARHYDTVRATLIDDIVTHYEARTVKVHATGIFAPQYEAVSLHNVALSLCHPNPRCKHACAERGCYMCPDPVHHNCFDCGRNVAVALYLKGPGQGLEAPLLTIPGSEGHGTRLGTWLEHFTGEIAIEVREETTYAMYIPDAESCTGFKQEMGKVTKSSPWAFRWWYIEWHRQWFVDLRCEMRRRAVSSYYKHNRTLKFTEDWIMKLEKTQPKWDSIQQLGKHFAVHGEIAWKAEYKKRVEAAVAKNGGDVDAFIPAFDQKKDEKTCRDAEWFG